MIFLLRLVFLPFRLVFGATGLSFRLGYRTGHVLGYRRMFFFGLGVGTGLLLAPVTGRELRAKLRERIEGGPLPTPAEPPLPTPARPDDRVAVAGTPAPA